ncbi:putative metal-binding motif-containing protein [Pyxidicoccus sp. MSG2]|uniref:putative metal-binding motif-containing protein n=1 Tax=Pyxidicoccus sp. MSG2 TaxID=2996790 RepID=UPI00226F5D4F|nr:putative metal-binding motif-containing protein [Pyxidicoccus sp. MSG2]MCY1015633.1 putative metal-binding motif-containing protein [Pyxidicoccus sp. MSG2]
MKALISWGAAALMTLSACTVPNLEDIDPGSSIEVEVSFDFRAGCITVLSRDKANPANSERQTFPVMDRDAATRLVKASVKRTASWGPALEIISTAHEHTCDGAEVARNAQEATLERLGIQTLTVHLSAVDADGDGYVPAANGGTDCDDGNAEVVTRSFYKDEDGDGYGAGTAVRGCVAAPQYVEQGGDCDDASSARAPNQAELCDGVDNNCVDGIDEGLPSRTFYLDSDHDGVGAGAALSACSAPANHVSDSGDCDDSDAARKPGLAEVCDDKDNDCDTVVDEGLTVSSYYRDADADGYGNPADSREKCDQPTGYVASNTDCNDTLASVHPGAAEVCNDVDDNCVGGVDEGLPVSTYFRDADTDGYGSPTDARQKCDRPTGYVASNTDCNDTLASVNPGAAEVCNDVDDNCGGGTDEGFNKTWYRDADADGHGAGAAVTACTAPAGHVATSGDCNDTVAAVHPGATEMCNDVDDNCAGGVDEGLPVSTYYRDADLDGHGNPTDSRQKCDQPAGYVANSTDCNDALASVHPGATEVCNDVDDNCTSGVDEGLPVSTYYRDVDKDGYGNPADSRQKCDQPTGYVPDSTDCNDSLASVHPGATEVCNDVDDNCVGGVDEGLPVSTYYRDADSDGYGNPADSRQKCNQPGGYVPNNTDCNDGLVSVHPGANEVCNDIDDNCAGGVDEYINKTWYRDADADGYGTGAAVTACVAPAGHVAASGDCNDNASSVRPGATEVCNDVDDNCAGGVDEGLPVSTYYRDADSDGYGNPASSLQKCNQPGGYVPDSTDCNDSLVSVHPGATEVCNDVDDNCVGGVDEGLPVSTYYRDADADGHGNPADSLQKCNQPSGYVANSTDCNDVLASVHPGANEVCNDIDDNCAGGVDEYINKTWYRDADADGYGTGAAVTACVAPAGHVAASGDCNDNASSVRPGATEVCNDVDDNCAGGVDEGLSLSTYYRDADSDGYGNPADSRQKCNQPSGYVANSTDCNDALAAVNPGATEVCNDVDDNCVGGVDEGSNKNWHLDSDQDGYGVAGNVVVSCSKPANRVAPTATFDCNDANSAVNPGAAERCNDIDDNCDGNADETWPNKGKGCLYGGNCPGVYVCRSDGTGVTCTLAIEPIVDTDGDGVSTSTSPGQNAQCFADTPPSSLAARQDDCDDSDPYNKPDGVEVCDDRDNNCGDDVDEGDICAGAGWKELTDAAVLGRDWYAVAVNHGNPSGYPVWLAGEQDALARRAGPDEPFVSFDGECGAGVRWTAAWVRPSDGHVFLAGSNGFLAEHTGESCTVTRFWGETSEAMRIQGFASGETTTLSITAGRGIFSWSPGSAPVKVGTANPALRGEPSLPDTTEARGFTPTAVAAPDPSSVYVTDSEGAILRHTGRAGTATSSWVTHFRASGVLLDLDLASSANVWAVGPDGRVVHFPEP